MPCEVITFGEAMIRLSPPNFQRLEQTSSLDLQAGGAELNTAVALARLGRSAAWISRLTRNPLGRIIASRAQEAGVGTEHVVWTNDDRVGVYFLEFGAAPRASSVLYDRKSSAISQIRPGMVNWKAALAGAKWFHVTGITPALSESAAETTREALQAARQERVQVSIDLNYRSKLWSEADAGRWMSQFMQWCDVLITTEEDAERVFGHLFFHQRILPERNGGDFQFKSSPLRSGRIRWCGRISGPPSSAGEMKSSIRERMKWRLSIAWAPGILSRPA